MAVQRWLSNLDELTQSTRELLPNILVAAALILAGFLLGHLLRAITRRLTRGAVERMARSPSLAAAMERTEVTRVVPRIVAGFVFWLVLLFFAATALEALGLPVITNALSRFVYYLPNVLAAGLIIAAGIVVGRLARATVTRAAASARVAAGPTLGRLADGGIVLLAGVVALDELGIDSSALVVALTIVFGSVMAAVGLAFGLGARTAVANIIASQALAKAYRVGQTVRIDGLEGRIIETTPRAVILATDQGRMLVPAKKFDEEASLLLSEER